MVDFSGRRKHIFDDSTDEESWQQKTTTLGHVDVVPLQTLGDWDRFYERVSAGTKHNKGPWNRCVTLLRGHGVISCVIERHYVCLDLRSENAAFNAHLDSSVDRAAVRLHFFRRNVQNNMFALSDSQRKSYVGYVIVREPGSPLIGRTVIKAPTYIRVCAAIDEPVNFFGQKLMVRGVAFMQQDERFAVCAHVAMWTILYSAYRKGIIERQLIADVVFSSRRDRTMHPSAPAGLTDAQVQQVLQNLGLHVPIFDLSNELMLPFDRLSISDLEIDGESIATFQETYEQLAAQLDPVTPPNLQASFTTNPSVFIANLWRLAKLAEQQRSAGILGECGTPAHDEVRIAYRDSRVLMDSVVRNEVEAHLVSGFPVYCQTSDHAMVLCGIGKDRDGFVYYFHDDQFGPYVASRSIVSASRQGFMHQAYNSALRRTPPSNELLTPRKDLAMPREVSDNESESDRAVMVIGLPGPARSLLPPSIAKRSAANFIRVAIAEWREIAPDQTIAVEDLRVSLVMGLDYKDQRRRHSGDSTARAAFSTVHLAEWVVVVENVVGGRYALWDFIFDGSSGGSHPILQLARIEGRIVYKNPLTAPTIEVFSIGTRAFPILDTPRTVGKARSI